MLVVEKHAFLQEVELGAVCWDVFGVIGFGAHFLTGGRLLELKLIKEERGNTQDMICYCLSPKIHLLTQL